MFSFQDLVVNASGNTTIPKIPALPGVEKIGATGILTLEVTSAILGACAIIFLVSSYRQPKNLRLFHYVTFLIVLIASISYACMAAGIGAAFIEVPGKHHAVREVFYTRYVDWMFTTPLLLLDLALLAGIPPVDIVLLMVADVGMIATGLVAALHSATGIKWGLYVLSNIFFVYVIYGLLITGRKAANIRSDAVGTVYIGISLFTVALWAGYPAIWALAEGANYVTADTEVLLYAILDVLAKGVFGFWLLGAHASMADSHVPLPDSWVEPQASYGAVSSTDRA